MHTIWIKTKNKKCNKTTKYNLSHKLIKSVPKKKKKKNPAFISAATNCNKIQSEQNTYRKCNEIRKYNLSHKLMKSEQNKNKQKKNRSNPFRSHVVGSGEEDERRSKQSGGRRCCDSLSRPVKHNADFPLGDCPSLSLSLSLMRRNQIQMVNRVDGVGPFDLLRGIRKIFFLFWSKIYLN